MTGQVTRPWAEPISVQKTSRVIPARAGADGLPGGGQNPQGVLEIDAGSSGRAGRFNCADVYIQAPPEWATALVIATVINDGQSSAIVDSRIVGEIQNRPAGGGDAIRGILFSIRGRPFGKLAIEVFPQEERLGEAVFAANAWGGPIGIHGDRAQRSTVDLYARNDQQFIFSAAVPIGVTTIQGPNPSGGRLAVTSVSWTQDGLGSVALQSSGGTTLVESRLAAAGQFTPAPYIQPLFLPRGEALQVTNAAAGTVVNVAGFLE